jgi:peptide subunit release factor 1 (eRF1)
VLVNECLTSPPSATAVRWSDYPYLVPLIDLDMRYPAYVFAAVDRTGAEIAVLQGNAVRSETVVGSGYPVHKPVTAGWSGYGDFQRTTEEAIRMNIRAVVDRLTALWDETDPEVVFVCGEMQARTDVVSALPDRVAERVSQLPAQAYKSSVEDQEIRDLIATEFDRRRRAETVDAAERFQAQIGRQSGLAAEGLAAVSAALRNGAVDTLIVGELGDVTVVTGRALTAIAPDADVLSELGEPMERVVRADEALPFAAIAVGAALVRADNSIAPADGVGALLRYAAVPSFA